MTTTLAYETITIAGRNGRPFTFTGVQLGAGGSRRDEHGDHEDRFARRGERCSACRWLAVAIYRRRRADADDSASSRFTYDYVVHTVGDTVVPGEKRFSRIGTTESPYEVVELLTVRKPGQDPYIAVQSSRALAQAANVDDGIRDSYINRAVV
jgi:hypothetical protein